MKKIRTAASLTALLLCLLLLLSCLQGCSPRDGVDGLNGADGADGKDGRSAYEIAVAAGFRGTEAEWLASLKGEQGEQGVQGAQGAEGPQGEQGAEGAQGPQGEQGVQGESGSDGIGIEKAEIIDGRLVITYTDGRTANLGQITADSIATPEGLLTPTEATALLARSTVTVVVSNATAAGVGSGFVYDAAGYVVTNNHVVEDMTAVQVIAPDGLAYDATVVGTNADADVAVLKIEAEGLVAATLGSSSALLAGDSVVALGTPYGTELSGTATFGAVSNPCRILPVEDSAGNVLKKIRTVQIDVAVNPGNSGGPLADMRGHVVGMVTMKLSGSGDTTYENLSFALPIDGVKVIADAIIESGSFTGDNPITEGRSVAGVNLFACTAGKWHTVNATTGKVTVSDTQSDGAYYAAAAGLYVMSCNGGDAVGKLQEGDIILRINGLHTTYIAALSTELNRHWSGETVLLTVLRGGSEITVELTVTAEE